jgi:hypothetical protein
MNLKCFALVGGGGVKSIEDQGFQIRQGIEVAPLPGPHPWCTQAKP